METKFMKHLLNNMTEEEKNSIREQHTDKLKVVTESFSKLVESKLGDVKPINEQFILEEVGIKVIKPIQIKVKNERGFILLVTLNEMSKESRGCFFKGTIRNDKPKRFVTIRFTCDETGVTLGYFKDKTIGMKYEEGFGIGGNIGENPATISKEASKLLNQSCGCNAFAQNQQPLPNSQDFV